MTLVKTSILSSISMVIRMGCYFIIGKITAIFLGPAGFAVVGQFQNFVQFSLNFSGISLGHGIIKFVSEHRNNEEQKGMILSTAFIISLVNSFFIGFLLFIFRDYIALKILKNSQYSIIIAIFALTFIFNVLNGIFLLIMNGEQDIKRLTSCNIASNISALLLTIYFVTKYQVFGGLLVITLNPVLMFFVSIFFVVKSRWFKIKNFLYKPSKIWLMTLFRYALMTFTGALLFPIVQLVLRGYIIHTLSWQEAGYWEAITKISDAYLAVITSTLSVYYFPKLSELKSTVLIKKEILQGYKIIFPVAVIIALFVFIFKKNIIHILFSKEFLPMIILFKYQLLGDVLKIGSWLISILMIVKGMVRSFILTEIGFASSYILMSMLFMHYYGLIGITIAFAINYGTYWLFIAIYLPCYFRKKVEPIQNINPILNN